MDNAETARMREEILRELEPLLYENLAAAEWGRALVRVQRAPVGDRVRVVGIDIEDLVGDEGKVDAALAGRDARALLPLLADATVALAATCGVEVDDIEGGTILRRPGGGFAWLPGLVHAPSAGFERLRDAATERVLGKQDALARRGVADRFEVDLERGSISFVTGERREARAVATLLGSFARASCTWVWAWANPSLAEGVKRRAAAVCDAVPQRDLWELTTPQFATDEGTSWALCSLVCEAVGGEGLYKAPHPSGCIFFLLRAITFLD